MIIEYVCNFFLGIIHYLVSKLPDNPAPAWLTTAGEFVGTVYAYSTQLGVWFPVELVRTVVIAVLTAGGVGFVIKVCRTVASFGTGGGGSAG